MAALSEEERDLITESVKTALAAAKSDPTKPDMSLSGVLLWLKANPTWVVVGFTVATIVCKHLGIALPLSYDDVYGIEAALGAGAAVHTIKNS